MYQCVNCAMGCSRGQLDQALPSCPSKAQEILEKARNLYEEAENSIIVKNAAVVEAAGYGVYTRVREIVEFAKGCGYKRLGLAFCMGLRTEAVEFAKILEAHGFEVVSVICKNGALPKETIGMTDAETISGNCKTEVMCNPIGQALFLNEQKPELNILLGLCVGHDTLVMKYLEAPVTTLAVKDRVTGHNPLAAIYTAGGYYKKKLYDAL